MGRRDDWRCQARTAISGFLLRLATCSQASASCAGERHFPSTSTTVIPTRSDFFNPPHLVRLHDTGTAPTTHEIDIPAGPRGLSSARAPAGTFDLIVRFRPSVIAKGVGLARRRRTRPIESMERVRHLLLERHLMCRLRRDDGICERLSRDCDQHHRRCCQNEFLVIDLFPCCFVCPWP
jgi:hypothetical protein